MSKVLSVLRGRDAPGTPNQQAAKRIAQVVDAVGEVFLDKREIVRRVIAGLLAGRHILLEDRPGNGKTTLSHALSKALGISSNRVQFTSELLPSDILGSSIFNRDIQQFEFKPGPVFTQLLLADEINRAGPRTQSALLEAMEERRVTVDGQAFDLPAPFLVIATQNPNRSIGTHPLPESQLDRFLFCLQIGYPSPTAEIDLLTGTDAREKIQLMESVLQPGELNHLSDLVQHVHVSPALARYVQRIGTHTRESGAFQDDGLSPRCLISLVRAAKAWALMRGDDHVIPDDIKDLYPSVAAHRLLPLAETGVSPGPAAAKFHAEWLKKIPVEA